MSAPGSLSIQTHTAPLKMPAAASGSRSPGYPMNPAQSGSSSRGPGTQPQTRSSRRRIGSSGPPVLLGGGVGILGSNSNNSNFQPQTQALSPTSTASSTGKSPVTSPTSTVFYTPTTIPTPNPASVYSTASPASPSVRPGGNVAPSTAPPRPERRSPSQPPMSKFPSLSGSPSPSLSGGSLASASSTSSRTLKTPHSKLASNSGSVEVASGSQESVGTLRSDTGEESRSPTPGRRASPHLSISLGEREKSRTPNLEIRVPSPRLPISPASVSPVPTIRPTASRTKTSTSTGTGTGTSTSASATGTTDRGGYTTTTQRLAAPEVKNENRLSQGWEHINLALEIPSPPRHNITTKKTGADRGRSVSPQPQSRSSVSPNPASAASALPMRPRLPPPMMVPLKQQLSPTRPSMERNHSAPLEARASSEQITRPEYKARASFDQLPPQAARTRKTSFSTPPQAVLDASTSTATSSSSVGAGPSRLHLWRAGTSKFSTPPLGGRKSEEVPRRSEGDLLQRPSVDLLGATSTLSTLSKKELKAMQKEAQRNLGVVFTPTTSSSGQEDGSVRKPSGLSLKKSSGALKALFQKSSTSKSKGAPPPMPDRRINSESAAFPSQSDSMRSRNPGPASTTSRISSDVQRQVVTGRGSFSSERVMYPVNPRAPTPRQQLPEDQERTRKPSRDLPPLPAPSPVPLNSKSLEQQQRSIGSTSSPTAPSTPPKPKQSRLSAALPTSSLPYLSALANGPGAGATTSAEAAVAVAVAGAPATPPKASRASPSSSSSLAAAADADSPSPLFRPSKSLHLLSLPDLDLDFDLSFDKVGTAGNSPSTPRRGAPRRSPTSPSRIQGAALHSPSRSMSTSTARPRPYPSPIKRNASTASNSRRRSQSYDGGANMLIPQSWDTTHVLGSSSGSGNLFGTMDTSMSSSAPILALSRDLDIDLDVFLSNPSSTSPIDFSQVQGLPPAPRPATTADVSLLENDGIPSAPASLDHTTPSEASSSAETEGYSPSSLQTPTDDRPIQLPEVDQGQDHGGSETSTPTPTAKGKSAAVTMTTELQGTSLLDQPFSYTATPPSIPLPSLPNSTELTAKAPVAPVVVVVEPIKSDKDIPGLGKPRVNTRVLTSRGRAVVVEPSLGGLKSIARDIERLLISFRYPTHDTTASDRINSLKTQLMPKLHDIDSRPLRQDETLPQIRRTLFEWADALLFELQIEQTANERGACLEALSAVVESAPFKEDMMGRDQPRWTSLLIRVMGFVMAKLGAKGVFHNTLLFSGRFLAFAFFRVPHVGEQLVTVLQPPRGALSRFTMGVMEAEATPLSARPRYPDHLAALSFDNPRAYTARLANLSPSFETEEERDAFLFQPGNWLRRWQSDDSELFPAFYRAYHYQLAQYLSPAIEHYENLNQPLPASVLLRAPGYAHLATIFARKCHSYILGSVNAVTTSSSAVNFEATETAGFRGSQKPPVLETANRRLVETLSTFTHSRMMVPHSRTGRMMEYDGSALWSSMIDLWSKSIISKTSLYAPKGVFCLFDLLDGIVDPPRNYAQPTATAALAVVDIPHLIWVIRLILTQGEHALTLVKVIAFVFTHWEVLTQDSEDRRELCMDLLLNREVFERLCLFWSQSVRSYVLRLVVFRLGHIHTKRDESGHQVEIEAVRLLQTRLQSIKTRHDELEPSSTAGAAKDDENTSSGSSSFADSGTGASGLPRSRSTITMVTELQSPHLGSSSNKAEKLLGLGLGVGDESKKAKASGWFKKFGKGKKDKKAGTGTGTGRETPTPTSDLSPSIGGNSPLLGAASAPQGSAASPSLAAPDSASPTTPSSLDSTEEEAGSGGRQHRPPTILTHAPEPATAPALSPNPNGFTFEFELPTSSPRSDAFDPTPTPPPSSPIPQRRHSQPPSPRSPHMSRSFSKRSSLLPPQTARELDALLSSSSSASPNGLPKWEKKEKGYEKRLHAYAIRMLAELEDAQKEYDEWWSDGGVGKVDGAPPRLAVAWPFHEGED